MTLGIEGRSWRAARVFLIVSERHGVVLGEDFCAREAKGRINDEERERSEGSTGGLRRI